VVAEAAFLPGVELTAGASILAKGLLGAGDVEC